MAKPATSTSAFGVSKRENHDASGFYARFTEPELSNDVAISAGRVDFPDGSDFASLWGGGTLPAWRGRGVFRSLVAYRARLARERGYRYLQVDASPDSRPILQRLGFTELATTTPFAGPGGGNP